VGHNLYYNKGNTNIQTIKKGARMEVARDIKLVESFVDSMKESLRFFSEGKLSENEINYLAEYIVNRLDFNNRWQMHKGLGYFAKITVREYLEKKEIA
jgi:hypothetical protein